jgi:hypothetical protein
LCTASSSDAEPAREQVLQVALEGRERRVVLREPANVGAQPDEELGPAEQVVELRQQPRPARLHRRAGSAHRSGALVGIRGPDDPPCRFDRGVERRPQLGGDERQERVPAVVAQADVGRGELGGALPGAQLAAPSRQALVEQAPQRVDVGRGRRRASRACPVLAPADPEVAKPGKAAERRRRHVDI